MYADSIPICYLPPSRFDNPSPLICLLQILSLLVFPGSSKFFLLVQNTFSPPLISGDIWASLTDPIFIPGTYQSTLKIKAFYSPKGILFQSVKVITFSNIFSSLSLYTQTHSFILARKCLEWFWVKKIYTVLYISGFHSFTQLSAQRYWHIYFSLGTLLH